MNQEIFSTCLNLLFENFWIVKTTQPEEYRLIKRYRKELDIELRKRFGLSLLVRPQFIQLFRRPFHLQEWMGIEDFKDVMDYVLLMHAMAYIEEQETNAYFLLNELIESIERDLPEDYHLEWTNYLHRKSLVRVLKKLIDLAILEVIQGEIELFEQNEDRNILYTITTQSRYLLGKTPDAFVKYEDFDDFWQEIQNNQLEDSNQALFTQLMCEPVLYRNSENEQDFIRLRNYQSVFARFVEEKTDYQFELTKDVAMFTLDKRDSSRDIFPSRKVLDEILVQLQTVLFDQEQQVDTYGVGLFTMSQWQLAAEKLKQDYQSFWSKEYKELKVSELANRLLERAQEFQMVKVIDEVIYLQPVLTRMVAKMEDKRDEK